MWVMYITKSQGIKISPIYFATLYCHIMIRIEKVVTKTKSKKEMDKWCCTAVVHIKKVETCPRKG